MYVVVVVYALTCAVADRGNIVVNSRLHMLVAIAAAFAAAFGILGAPAGFAASPQKIFGFFDARTNTFTPAPAPPTTAQDAATAASSPVVVSGRMTINTTIAIARSIPANATIQVTAGLFVTDAVYNNVAVGVTDVVRSGNTGKASVSFAYRMAVVSASETAKVTVIASAASPTNPSLELTLNIKLPPNGTTTVVNFLAAL